MSAGDEVSIWKSLAAPLAKGDISWRQDGKPMQRDGKSLARFVAYVGSTAVRERLDAIVPGEWTIILELLPVAHDADGVEQAAFKARLSVRGIAREDVGLGRDLKAAATDSFKRAAMRFGIGTELHVMSVFVQLDGDGKYAKPIEEPQLAWDRKHPAPTPRPPTAAPTARPATPPIIDPRIPRGAPAPARPTSPEPPPPDDGDRTY